MEKVFRKTGKVMNVPLLKRFCEGGVFGWWETVAERVIQFSQPRPQVQERRSTMDEGRLTKHEGREKEKLSLTKGYNYDIFSL